MTENSQPLWTRYWAVMKNDKLKLWQYPGIMRLLTFYDHNFSRRGKWKGTFEVDRLTQSQQQFNNGQQGLLIMSTVYFSHID